MDQAFQGNPGRLVNQEELVSPAQAGSRARAGRSPPDQPLAQILPQRSGILSEPTKAMPCPILLRFLRGTRQRSSAATSSVSAARSTSLPSSSTTRPKIIAYSNSSGIPRRTTLEWDNQACRRERDWASLSVSNPD